MKISGGTKQGPKTYALKCLDAEARSGNSRAQKHVYLCCSFRILSAFEWFSIGFLSISPSCRASQFPDLAFDLKCFETCAFCFSRYHSQRLIRSVVCCLYFTVSLRFRSFQTSPLELKSLKTFVDLIYLLKAHGLSIFLLESWSKGYGTRTGYPQRTQETWGNRLCDQ